jgi:hypothetical protein
MMKKNPNSIKINNSEGPESLVGGRIARITALMAVIYGFFYLLPSFAPERPANFLRQVTGDPSPELCDFSSIGFTEVNQGRSPLILRMRAHSELQAGEEVTVTAALGRPSGRAVGLSDLEERHTEKFHLLIVDPSLGDYQHEHPRPTAINGEYEFTFTPRHGGDYRFFAEVVPTVTGRPVQAVADLAVAGVAGGVPDLSARAAVDGYEFALTLPEEGVRAKRPAILALNVRNQVDGEGTGLEPVMGSWAHIVAFEGERRGFAHMHPLREGLDLELDPREPEIEFMFFAERPGVYTVWAQVKIEGRELFAPFSLEVL